MLPLLSLTSKEKSEMKAADDYFTDWEGVAFGFGYGTGEEYTIPALKSFLAAVPAEGNYDYEALEAACGPAVAWLLINVLCREDIIEYGTSPRFGWLTSEGKALKAYVDAHDAEQLYEAAAGRDENYIPCYPDHCNCAGDPCHNPFWKNRRP